MKTSASTDRASLRAIFQAAFLMMWNATMTQTKHLTNLDQYPSCSRKSPRTTLAFLSTAIQIQAAAARLW